MMHFSWFPSCPGGCGLGVFTPSPVAFISHCPSSCLEGRLVCLKFSLSIYIYIFIRHIVFHTYLQIFPHQYATLTSRTSITIIYLYTVSFNTPRITIVILHMHMKFHLRCKNMFHSLVWWYVRKRRRKTMWWSCWSQLRNPLRNTRQGEPLG